MKIFLGISARPQTNINMCFDRYENTAYYKQDKIWLLQENKWKNITEIRTH